jgi:F-type H+-transporting ATPase subunit b
MESVAVEMNWSTFVLEILNFLILVWILKRFLYKPVLDVIARRRANIEKTLADAQALHAEAEKLQEQYESRLSDWNKEKQQARESLAQELEAERVRKIAELQSSLVHEKEKIKVTEERHQRDARQKIEETALIQGARFATHLLEQASGPDTEIRLVELVITELGQLSAESVAAVQNSFGKRPEAIEVRSAFPLPSDLAQRLTQALTTITSSDIPLRFEQDSKLLAGLQITIGHLVLGINLRDELKGFAALAHGE